jgi:hypothetical protein
MLMWIHPILTFSIFTVSHKDLSGRFSSHCNFITRPKKKTGLEAVMEVEECLEMDSRHHTRDIARRARCRRIRRLFVTRVAL